MLFLDQIQHKTNAFKTTFVNVKCSSSKFLEEPNNVEIEPEQKFYVNLAVYNQSKHTETLPVGVIADITPMTDEHQADFSKAASETASDMACEAVEQLEQVQYNYIKTFTVKLNTSKQKFVMILYAIHFKVLTHSMPRKR
jgi:hypothetical protein